MGISTIKYVFGYNYHRIRNVKINNNTCRDRCPRYNQVKYWEHVILYQEITKLKEEYIKDLEEELKKTNKSLEGRDIIKIIIIDI